MGSWCASWCALFRWEFGGIERKRVEEALVCVCTHVEACVLLLPGVMLVWR